MSTRSEHMAWAKERALAYVDAGDPRGWDATTRQAAMRRHPSGFSLDEVNPVWTDCDQLAAWTARLDDEPNDHPIPDSWAVVLILFLGIVIPWVIVIAAVRWAVS